MTREVRLYVGLDDTDTLEVGGTGQLARSLAHQLVRLIPGCRLDGVSRHQLLDDPRVPRTRRNRCSCIVLWLPSEAARDAQDVAREHVRAGSASGADPGLCIALEARIGPPLLEFGGRAKRELLDRALALRVAAEAGVCAEPLGGTGDGVVGALAAVGLRRTSADGWLTLWARIRSLEGTLPVDRLVAEGIDAVEDEHGELVPPGVLVDTRGRVRPALRDGRRVLLVSRTADGGWHAVKPERGGMA